MSEAMRTPGKPLFSEAESTRKKAIATVVKLAGDDSGTGDDWILGAGRRFERQACKHLNRKRLKQTWKTAKYQCRGWPRGILVTKEYLRKRVGTFRQWREGGHLREPSGACCEATTLRLPLIAFYNTKD